jgi:hypothetical protein
MDDESFGSALAIAYDLHRVVYVPSWCERNPQRSPEAISLPRRIRRSYRWCSEAKIRADVFGVMHSFWQNDRLFSVTGMVLSHSPPRIFESAPKRNTMARTIDRFILTRPFPSFSRVARWPRAALIRRRTPLQPSDHTDGARLLLQIESATLDQSAGRSPRSSSFSLRPKSRHPPSIDNRLATISLRSTTPRIDMRELRTEEKD